MLHMRQIQVHYISLIDVFAPCLVSSRLWNNDALMAEYCGYNKQNFQEQVLKISGMCTVYFRYIYSKNQENGKTCVLQHDLQQKC